MDGCVSLGKTCRRSPSGKLNINTQARQAKAKVCCITESMLPGKINLSVGFEFSLAPTSPPKGFTCSPLFQLATTHSKLTSVCVSSRLTDLPCRFFSLSFPCVCTENMKMENNENIVGLGLHWQHVSGSSEGIFYIFHKVFYVHG